MSETAAVAVLLSMLGIILAICVGWYVIQAIAYWKIFTKAGEAGWKSLIPVYNVYIQYKISWNTTMFFAMVACILVGTIANNMDGVVSMLGSVILLAGSVITWIACHKLSLSFGHGIGFTLGLIFLNPIFTLILGFSSDQYQGPQ